MNVAIVSRNRSVIEPVLARHGFLVVETSPELVVSFGGDGTVMKSEEFFPGVPKILLRDSAICKKCSSFSNDEVLEKITRGEYATEEMPKLRATVAGESIEGMNDIAVHNKDPRHAMRYRFSVNGVVVQHEIIGDGIVAATPFGSTGYYRSITHSFFEIGFGVAFNNSIEQSDHMLLDDRGFVELEVTRGPAIVYADNQEKIIDIETGARVRIERAHNVARIVVPR